MSDLKSLAEKDPEFFKYLQENDAELLDFNGEDEDEEMEDASDEEESDEESDEEEGAKGKKGKKSVVEKKEKPVPVLTKELLKQWQRSILTVRRLLCSTRTFSARVLASALFHLTDLYYLVDLERNRLVRSARFASCFSLSVRPPLLEDPKVQSVEDVGRSKVLLVRFVFLLLRFSRYDWSGLDWTRTSVDLRLSLHLFARSLQQAHRHFPQVHSRRSFPTRPLQRSQRKIVRPSPSLPSFRHPFLPPNPQFLANSKLSTNTKSYATAQRLIKSYFVSLQSLLQTVSSDSGIPALAVMESSKLIPWVVGNRKVARGWVKVSFCLLLAFDPSFRDVCVLRSPSP